MTITRRPVKLNLTITARAGRAHVSYLKKMLPRAHSLLKSRLRELSIALVGDKPMSELHDRFMGQPTTTDVLTFPLDQDSRGRAISGEIILCVPEANRQAKIRGISTRDELLLYAIHGLLHLLGMDDTTHAGYSQMHQLEDRILAKLGIGPVFSAPQRSKTHRIKTPATS
jgi:probable rRNA maturation factor